ncbi:MAG: YggS family pyridoxal phosphate-dependent enzyme [candidate division Zixibacteria bacterium]|nr:YggS family pyridoxal phosphate-dependent enzyme [candidate division Zixibacteria bacterium]
MPRIKDNLLLIRGKIDWAAQESGRRGEDITLVAVTKQVGPKLIAEALLSGVDQIGESKIQEAEAKFKLLPPGVKRHLIGHLQTNKVNKAIQMFDLIQSVDSYKLAAEIDRRSVAKKMSVLVEVNISGEAGKNGIPPTQIVEFLKELESFQNLEIQGLMTIGPNTAEIEKIRSSFKEMSQLFRQASELSLSNCRMQYLSMGMSADYDIAIQEGSNMVRVGTALFGARN